MQRLLPHILLVLIGGLLFSASPAAGDPGNTEILETNNVISVGLKGLVKEAGGLPSNLQISLSNSVSGLNAWYRRGNVLRKDQSFLPSAGLCSTAHTNALLYGTGVFHTDNTYLVGLRVTFKGIGLTDLKKAVLDAFRKSGGKATDTRASVSVIFNRPDL